MRTLGGGPVLLIGAYRDTDLSDDHPLVELLADLERDGPQPRIRLRGLDVTEIAEVAAAEGQAVEAGTAGAIREQTDGNPFFVKQVLRALGESGDPRAVKVSAGLRDVILRRVARLGGEAARVLRVAALLGREFDLRLLAPVVDLREDELLDHLDAALAAGLLWEVAAAPGRYTFVHALVRTALEQELSATRRAHLHRRIGEAIEARHGDRLDPWLEELTRHFGAAGPEESGRAVAYAVRAAEQATGRLAYEEAAGFLEGALAAHERDDEQRARLLHDLATAHWRLGRRDAARETFDRAAEGARRAGAVELFARAALGHSGSAWEWFGDEDPASAHLLEEALALLPEADTALRAQVLARLGGVLYFSAQAEARAMSLIESAIRMSHRVADDVALASALSAAQFAYWRTELVETRVALADELVHVVERTGTPEQLAEATMWRASALLTLCDRDAADADIARHAELARRSGQPELLMHAAGLRAMLALLDGRWTDAERAADDVLAAGGPASVAAQEHGIEVFLVRGEQLRVGELIEPMKALAQQLGGMPAWRSTVAWAHALAGDAETARAVLAELRRDGFAVLPRDVNFDLVLAVLAHIAGELDDPELAAEVEPHLRPLAGYWLVFGVGPATLGPVAYSLGLCSLLTGHFDTAVADFELALEKCRAMRCRPYEAHASLGLASALERRAAPGDAERALVFRNAAVALGEALGMTRLLRDAARRRW